MCVGLKLCNKAADNVPVVDVMKGVTVEEDMEVGKS